jgi:hypothetical protein
LPTNKLLNDIGQQWDDIATYTRANWNERWIEWAPGADILKKIWASQGLSFDKQRDPLLLAEQITQPPVEIADLIRTLFGTP